MPRSIFSLIVNISSQSAVVSPSNGQSSSGSAARCTETVLQHDEESRFLAWFNAPGSDLIFDLAVYPVIAPVISDFTIFREFGHDIPLTDGMSCLVVTMKAKKYISIQGC